MAMPDLDQDHGAIAWGNWHDQFDGAKRLEAFVKSLYHPATAINATLRGLRDAIWLQSAEGAQLDGIGEIVGLPREVVPAGFIQYFGFAEQIGITGFDEGPMFDEYYDANRGRIPDDYYRMQLAWKIAVNNGHGTTEEIVSSLKLIFGAGRVIVTDAGNAKIRITLDRVPYLNTATMRRAMDYVPRLAGVGIDGFNVGGPKTFGFAEQDGFYGFDEGIMAEDITMAPNDT